MRPTFRPALLGLVAALALAGCATTPNARAFVPAELTKPLYPNETPELRTKIVHYANVYDVPVDLVQRVVIRESTHNPEARNGPYLGLMQIHPRTARGMGHYGPAAELLDADVNLKYAVKYLRGAWMVSDGSYDKAVHWYASGYYYEAKRRGLLEKTGLKT